MSQPRYSLRPAAIPIHAEQMCTPFNQRAAASRTDLRLFDRFFIFFRFSCPAHNFRYNIVAAPDPHITADSYVFSLYISQIVQRSFFYSDSVEIHRLHMSQRRQFSRASQLPRNVQKLGHTFFRLEFIGNHPPREFFRISHLFPQRIISDLDHHAVNQPVETAAIFLDFLNAFFQGLATFAASKVRTDLKTVLPQEFKHARLAVIRRVFNRTDLVEKRIQMARSRNGRVKISQRPRGCVSRVFKRFLCRFIILFQGAQSHDALALYFQQSLVWNSLRNRVNGAGLRKNSFARNAVSACSCLDQITVFIRQVQRQPVKLVFQIVLEVFCLSQLLRTLNPGFQFFKALHLVQ